MQNTLKLTYKLIKNDIEKNIDIDELVSYIRGFDKSEIDGELIRSFYITYKNGINNIFNILKENTLTYKNLEQTFEIEVLIEEYLEVIDFDMIFNKLIRELKEFDSL